MNPIDYFANDTLLIIAISLMIYYLLSPSCLSGDSAHKHIVCSFLEQYLADQEPTSRFHWRIGAKPYPVRADRRSITCELPDAAGKIRVNCVKRVQQDSPQPTAVNIVELRYFRTINTHDYRFGIVPTILWPRYRYLNHCAKVPLYIHVYTFKYMFTSYSLYHIGDLRPSTLKTAKVDNLCLYHTMSNNYGANSFVLFILFIFL